MDADLSHKHELTGRVENNFKRQKMLGRVALLHTFKHSSFKHAILFCKHAILHQGLLDLESYHYIILQLQICL